VDELAIASKNSTTETILKAKDWILAGTRGTGCRVSVTLPTNSTPLGSLKPGLGLAFHVYDRRIESGFGFHHLTHERDAQADTAGPAILQSQDAKANRRVLCLATRGKRSTPPKDILSASADRDVFTRSRALETLAHMGTAEAIPTIAKCVQDPEHAVRC
jgi:hypothetical protein